MEPHCIKFLLKLKSNCYNQQQIYEIDKWCLVCKFLSPAYSLKSSSLFFQIQNIYVSLFFSLKANIYFKRKILDSIALLHDWDIFYKSAYILRYFSLNTSETIYNRSLANQDSLAMEWLFYVLGWILYIWLL